VILGRILMVKTIFPLKIDAEKRRCGQKKGLDTQVSRTVNDEWWFLIKVISFYVNTITIPPCEYDCKVETKKISRSRSKRRWGMLFNTIMRVKSYQFLHKTSFFLFLYFMLLFCFCFLRTKLLAVNI